MDELTQLAIKYGTDKWGKHHYTPVYYEMFKDRRNEIKKVLEIGSAEGAGVRMFRDFFPNAQIYGMDNVDSRIFEEERIKIIKGDQFNLQDIWFMDTMITLRDMDIVIDDGSHRPEHQIFTALSILPRLKEGAIYIIEDVAKNFVADCLEPYKMKFIRVGERYDDQLIIIKNE